MDQIEGLKDDGIRYVKLRWASLRLSAVEKISKLLSRVVGYVIFIALLLIALAFLMVALAIWIGEMLGHLSLGFLISGGVFLLGGVVVFLLRDRIAVNSLVRYFIDVFFSDNDDENGTQE